MHMFIPRNKFEISNLISSMNRGWGPKFKKCVVIVNTSIWVFYRKAGLHWLTYVGLLYLKSLVSPVLKMGQRPRNLKMDLRTLTTPL